MSFLDPVKGFGVTFATMFKPVVTEDYPKHPDQPAPRYHGRHQLNRHPDGSDQHDPDQGDRDEHLPADGHELVVPDPGQAAAEPDEHEHEDQHLDEEPDHRPIALIGPWQQ